VAELIAIAPKKMNKQWRLVSRRDAAPAPGDVAARIERWPGAGPTTSRSTEGGSARSAFSLFNKPKAEDVTIFTRDLALAAAARGRGSMTASNCSPRPRFRPLRPVVADIRSRRHCGESFAELLARHEALFPAM